VTSAYDSTLTSSPAPEPFKPVPILAPEPFLFTGSGSEYFRIWVVNMLLSIVTIGIYSAWAKVRRMRYFYDNTRLAGSSFDYHGNPVSILKGRVIAVVFIGLYHLGPRLSIGIGAAMFILLMLISPWLIWKSLQFKLHNSSYRGIRFGLLGRLGSAYFVYLFLPFLAVLTAGLLVPLTHQRMKRFQHGQSRFGTTAFSFHASAGSFYGVYLLGAAVAIGGLLAITLVMGMSLAVFVQSQHTMHSIIGGGLYLLTMYLFCAVLYPLFMTLIQNLIWNNTRLGEHRLNSRMRWGRMSWIWLSNLVLIAVTLGLFTPFATIRLLRYRIESLTLLRAGDLNEFTANTEPSGSVTGEGMTDLLDFDISL
jgi:uncharacterized membrane protein YjgN (DUF898 family)